MPSLDRLRLSGLTSQEPEDSAYVMVGNSAYAIGNLEIAQKGDSGLALPKRDRAVYKILATLGIIAEKTAGNQLSAQTSWEFATYLGLLLPLEEYWQDRKELKTQIQRAISGFEFRGKSMQGHLERIEMQPEGAGLYLAKGLQLAKVTIAQMESETEQYRQGALAGKQDAKAIDKLNNRINQQLDHVATVLEEFPSGRLIRLITPASKSIFYGVVVGIDAKKRSGSPAAPNCWKMRILVADSVRQLMAWRIAQQLPRIKRLRPPQSKDWNEQLINPEGSEKIRQEHTDQLILHQLWRWYAVANALGKSEAYVTRITEVARDVVRDWQVNNVPTSFPRKREPING